MFCKLLLKELKLSSSITVMPPQLGYVFVSAFLLFFHYIGGQFCENSMKFVSGAASGMKFVSGAASGSKNKMSTSNEELC